MQFNIKLKFYCYIPPAPNQVINENGNKHMCCEFSHEDRDAISKQLLMTTNTTNYNSIVSSLNNGSHSKQFQSYYLMTKYCPELDNGVVQLKLKFIHLLTDNNKDTRMIQKSADENDYSRKKIKVKKCYYSQLKGGFSLITNYY